MQRTEEELEEIVFKNQVYERVFTALEKEGVEPVDTEESDSDDTPTFRRKKYNLRDSFIMQEAYLKIMKEAERIWEHFTSGNKAEKRKKMVERAELEGKREQKKLQALEKKVKQVIKEGKKEKERKQWLKQQENEQDKRQFTVDPKYRLIDTQDPNQKQTVSL